MNYYNEIKEELVNNEVYKRAKDYSKNRSDLKTYYNVGKLLNDAGKKYGEGIIKKYSDKLTNDLGKKYNERTLRRFRQFYNLFSEQKWSPVATTLTWSHFCELMPIKNIDKIRYYISICENQNVSKRKLRERIKCNEYERLDDKTKIKLSTREKMDAHDFIKNPILIRNKYDTDKLSEKMLKQSVLEDLSHFLNELGSGYAFIGEEYPIKLGDRYNYIDILLCNINYNCYVVVELKVGEIKKEHIGQVQTYMNYIDTNLRTINQNDTIGIIICKKGSSFIMQYVTNKNIYERQYELV